MSVLDNLRVAIGGIRREQAALCSHHPRRADRRRGCHHPGGRRDRVLSGGREPDQPARDEHPYGFQHRPLRSGAFSGGTQTQQASLTIADVNNWRTRTTPRTLSRFPRS